MKTLTLMLVAVAMTASSAAAQSPASAAPPSELRQAQIELRRLSLQQRLAEMQQRLEDLASGSAAQARVEQLTGAKLAGDLIELASDGVVRARGNVTLTFPGGVMIRAGQIAVGNDGTVSVLGNSQVTLTAK